MNDDVMLDARVRRGLQALPVPDQPRTTAALSAVTRRRRGPSFEPWRIVLVAAVVAGLLVLAPPLVRTLLDRDRPAPAPSPVGELRGTWTRVPDGHPEPTWDGAWTVTFGDGGVLGLTGPSGAQGLSDGAAYAVTGAQVRVDAFVNSVCYERAPGTYTWAVVADGLRLTPRDDDCEPRAELLSGTWQAVR